MTDDVAVEVKEAEAVEEAVETPETEGADEMPEVECAVEGKEEPTPEETLDMADGGGAGVDSREEPLLLLLLL